ncbi:MAG: protein-L-isoaspartate(D-aspartate) O-methyltransferase [Nanoarchaeota archaeon]|nr:protein-L-isoaspartate(D-aspartate) O-methyltransferase [Nanoarchaeota archaeon]MBU1051407.1 protein-L-isoaspartate(D-aspartate) O-methyltransferase [Nanoarchaeota archaeon]MBU1989022.1 protein-L-isoaspartate(D-aspartate) O-methyltransferase [Nanoarchaeota archaeon]
MDKPQLLASLKAQGFPQKILQAFAKVPRGYFLPQNLQAYAYEDQALPLEQGATISQPYTIAFMLNLLDIKPSQKILEIGSGCGYVLAILSKLSPSSKIYGIEVIKSLAEKSKQIISELKYKNVNVLDGNGFQGLKEKAPFDRILISAAADKLPEHLYPQLSNDGIIVTPVLGSIVQIKKQKGKIKLKEFPGFVFVPLVRA